MRLFRHELRSQLRLYTAQPRAGLLHLRAAADLVLPARLGLRERPDQGRGQRASRRLPCSPGCSATARSRPASPGFRSCSVIRRESGILKRVRATPLPAWAYVVALLLHDADRIRGRGRLHDRDSAASSSIRTSTTSSRSRSRCCSARRPSRALGSGADGSDQICGGRLGGRERDLPAGRVPRGAFFSPPLVPGGAEGDRERTAADVYMIRLVRDIVMLHNHADLESAGRRGRDRGLGLARSDRRAPPFPLGAAGRLGFAHAGNYGFR